MTQQLKTTALYCRLSKDDERQGESHCIPPVWSCAAI